MRTQLATPNNTSCRPSTYDQLFSMHGITMIFFFIIPMTTGAFGNYLIPLMIGARDMAFPRLNALSFWIFLGSGIFLYASFALGMAPERRLVRLRPAREPHLRPGPQHRLLLPRDHLQLARLDAHRRPVHRHDPQAARARHVVQPHAAVLFAQLAAAFGLLFALPSLSADAIFLYLDRNVGTHFFDAAQRRLGAALAGPLLDLRAPRGLHPDRAGVRHRDHDHPDVHAAQDGRLPARRDRRAARRLHRLRRLGAPHVRDRAADDRARRSSRPRRRWW